MEMEKTGTEHVYLHLSALEPSHIKSRFPNIYETCLAYGLDITKEPIPVAPAMHYMMGGIATDLSGRTALPHLFACGESPAPGCTAPTAYSNSLLDGLVFGHPDLCVPRRSAVSFFTSSSGSRGDPLPRRLLRPR